MRERGTVARLCDRGFGFIRLSNGGVEVFFLTRDVAGVAEGVAVEFTTIETQRGLRALNVRVVAEEQEADAPRLFGRVSSWNHEKGWGFIAPERGGEAIFCHVSAVEDGEQLAGGDVVEFAPATDGHGRPQAIRVRLAWTPWREDEDWIFVLKRRKNDGF